MTSYTHDEYNPRILFKTNMSRETYSIQPIGNASASLIEVTEGVGGVSDSFETQASTLAKTS